MVAQCSSVVRARVDGVFTRSGQCSEVSGSSPYAEATSPRDAVSLRPMLGEHFGLTEVLSFHSWLAL